jgi:uncharacterized membrane protein YeaQ/YmgE (transglycosylase-associated protein family)
MLFADMVLHLPSMVLFLVIGLSVGWLAGRVMKEPSYGKIGDLLLGPVGGLIGGVIIGLFVTGAPAFWAALLVAVLGACLLIAVARLIVLGSWLRSDE